MSAAPNDPTANTPRGALSATQSTDGLTRGHVDNIHSDASTNGLAERDTSEVSPSQHPGTMNGTELDSSPAVTSSSPNLQTLQQAQPTTMRSGVDRNGPGGAHNQAGATEPQAGSSSANAIRTSRPTDKRKRGKYTTAKPSPDEAFSAERGTVLKFGSNTEETLRRVVIGSRAADSMLGPCSTDWSFVKLFNDDDFIAAGQLRIPPNCEKPSKNVRDNAYIFFVIEGAVEVQIHKSTYKLTSGGSCIVPQGNNYSFKNISSRDARVFFCQARELPMKEVEEYTRFNLLPTQRGGPPTSKAAMLAMWLLQRFVAHMWRLRDRVLAWYRKVLIKYERFGSKQKLCLLFFVLGLMVRRLPFIGSPPLINIQLIRVV